MPDQLRLSQSQIASFYVDVSENQVSHFITLTKNIEGVCDRVIVDVGGGVGYFARNLHRQTGASVRVIDSDPISIERVKQLGIPDIEGTLGDALRPEINGDEGVVCFNLILHHLIGRTEAETRLLQKNALLAWGNSSARIFVNECSYESFFAEVSGRLIYMITSNRLLSAIGAVVGGLIPSLRANTFGVGVRFRSNREWTMLFEECGYSVSCVRGNPNHTPMPLRLLLIKQIRVDSFLLTKLVQPEPSG